MIIFNWNAPIFFSLRNQIITVTLQRRKYFNIVRNLTALHYRRPVKKNFIDPLHSRSKSECHPFLAIPGKFWFNSIKSKLDTNSTLISYSQHTHFHSTVGSKYDLHKILESRSLQGRMLTATGSIFALKSHSNSILWVIVTFHSWMSDIG